LIKKDFSDRIGEFEEVLQKIASDIASGVLFEKLPPSELLSKTEHYVTRLKDLAANTEEIMLTLKPEKTYTIKRVCQNFIQTITNFKEILLQNSPDPLANSRLAFEQLRKIVTDGSDLLFLMRDVRDDPSPLIDTILNFKKASETKGQVISIKTSEDLQPLLKHILSCVDEFRLALISLEKKVGEMKQIMRKLQEESLKMLSDKNSTQPRVHNEKKGDKGQLSLSSFKSNEGIRQHGNG